MRNNQLEVSDVPSEMMEQMRRQFDMDSRIIEMRTHQQVLVSDRGVVLKGRLRISERSQR